MATQLQGIEEFEDNDGSDALHVAYKLAEKNYIEAYHLYEKGFKTKADFWAVFEHYQDAYLRWKAAITA